MDKKKPQAKDLEQADPLKELFAREPSQQIMLDRRLEPIHKETASTSKQEEDAVKTLLTAVDGVKISGTGTEEFMLQSPIGASASEMQKIETQSAVSESSDVNPDDSISQNLRKVMAAISDCNIVKSLEKEFDMIDYSQWERTDRRRTRHNEQTPSLPPIKWLPEALGNHWKLVKKNKAKTTVRHATQEQKKSEGTIQLCAEKFCSKKCNRPWHKRTVLRADDACYMEMKEKINILKYLITAKKKQMDEYKEYNKNILNINMKLSEELKKLDENAMKESRSILIQYHKFKKGISGIGEWKQQEIKAAKDDLKDTEITVKQKSEELYRQVEEVNTRIRNARAELRMLKEFRDKELPIFTLKITQLEKEARNLTQKQQGELADVEEVTLAHRRTMENALEEKEQEIFQKIAKEQIQFMPPGLQELILHNAIMKKEIEIHKELNKKMERDNLDLQRNLFHLLKAKKDCREEIFTEIFKKQPKCTPITEVVLDIPRKECLPI